MPDNYGLPEGIELSTVFIVLMGIGLVTFILRGLPFVISHQLRGNRFLDFLGAYMPMGIMSILVFYTLVSTYTKSGTLMTTYACISLIFTLVLHHWRRSAVLSIFTGTAVYMILSTCFT